MKKLLTILSVMVLMFSVSNTFASKYKINDSAIENLFSKSYATTIDAAGIDLNQLSSAGMQLPSAVLKSGDKSAIAAVLLCFFLGGLGIHRLYLGTKAGVVIGYIGLSICFGLGGLLALIDFVFLLINYDDISGFEDCSRFFMWTCK